MSLKKLGRYDLIRVLGKGAMGLVYEGRDPNLDRRVAIKTIKVENLSEEAAAEYEARFRTEARSAARLQHPNIVSVYDSDRDGDIAFLVMEYIQGEDLKHHLDRGTLYSLEQSLGIVRDLLSALDYAHKQNIVHRDVKPANLLIESGGRIKLTDFGVARIQDSGEATRTQGSMVGTLKYMSPEQVQGQPIDARADLFSAGIVLYQLLTGRRPFDGDNDFSTIHQIIGHTPEPPSAFNAKLPPAIDSVVARALAKARDQRFATARDFAVALQAATKRASDTTIVPPPSPLKRTGGTATGVRQAGSLPGVALEPSGTGSGGSIVTQELELVYWKDIKDSTDVEDIEGFLVKFPQGIYADLARRRLKKLDSLAAAEGAGRGSVVAPPFEEAAHDTTRWMASEETVLASATPRPEATSTGPVGQFEKLATTATVARQAAPPDALSALAAEAQSLSAGAPALALNAADDPDLTRMGPAPAVAAAAAVADPVTPVAVPEASVQAVTAPVATAASAQPAQAPPSAPKSRLPVLVLAGLAALVSVGVGFKLLSGGGAPPAPTVSATSSTATPSGLPVASPAPAPQAQAPASAAVAATMPPVRPVPAVAKPAAVPKTAASNPARGVKSEAPKPDDTTKPAKPATATDTTAEPAAAPDAPAGPRQACENRVLLGFQICMSEQCARPVFRNHPICVERRAMEQQRRELQQHGK
ncbi:serine/threonine-protein kinase [Polaromonas sp.]|uniref:serine/threonine-protein kinase n=1 Tax=Polaromonas sp. TaxID=1869339 RepID=UPI002FCA66C4